MSYYYPEAPTIDYKERDKLTKKISKIFCRKKVPKGFDIKRPAWHRWVYGGSDKKTVIQKLPIEVQEKYGASYKK